ncbi:MAG: DNA polymerase III subunit alpha, partial [Spirochaetales bacterium]|nr:DNA polymerase III subunit alpha [Spirochaetales bacterium]
CIYNGVPIQTIERVWAMMLSFDGYSFCKPHSASYAMVSFQSAYLKTHHPAYFLAAVLTNQGGYYHEGAYVSEARRMGLIVEGPDLNRSQRAYVASGNTIIVGLMAIATLSERAILQIIRERAESGTFNSLEEAVSRLHLGREEWQSLSQSGALDALAPGTRRSDQLRVVLTTVCEGHKDAQLELFGQSSEVPLVRLPPARRTLEELQAEFETLGFLRNAHPLILYATHLQGIRRILAKNLPGHVGGRVTLVGCPIAVKRVFTSAREVMAFFSFEDETALFETVLFPEVYRRHERLLGSARPLVIQGVVESDEGALTVKVDRLSSL